MVGAFIVYAIFSNSSYLNGYLKLPADNKDFNGAHLALLATYGLAFSYISSAPILVMHACRFRFLARPYSKDTLEILFVHLLVMFLSLVVACLMFSGMWPGKLFNMIQSNNSWSIFGANFIFAYTIVIQSVFLIRVFSRKREYIDTYMKLAKVRGANRDKEYTEHIGI